MNTLQKAFFILIISLLINSQVNSQEYKIDFDALVIGISYKVIIENGWETEGALVSKDAISIKIKTELKTFTIEKEQVTNVFDLRTNNQLIAQKSNPKITFADTTYIVRTDEEKVSEEDELILGNALDTSLKTVELKDGSELIGHIREKDNIKIKFETLSGTMIDIKLDQIKAIENERSDYFIGNDPNKSRLLFAPTGRNLKGGTGYFSVTELFFPVLSFGITDYLTIAGGMTIVPGATEQLYYLNGKAGGLHFKNLDLSAGIVHTNITSNTESGLTAIYGIGTYGSVDASFTFGAGISFQRLDGNESSGSYPMLMLGGEIKLSNSAKLLSENWIPTDPDSYKILSLGVRFFGKRLAGDFGLLYLIDEKGESALGNGWPFIPWIGLNYNFDL